MINSSQIQQIYAMGAKLGLLDNNNHKDDLLHVLVYGLTGKENIKKLNNAECKIVTDELSKRMKQLQIAQQKHKTKKYEDTAKGMTAGQQRKVWALMYQLVELDLKPQTATIGKRLCGIIKKELHIDALPNDPFMWLGFDEANKLIESLKRYIKSAERKKGSDESG